MFIERFGIVCDVGRSMQIKLPRRNLKLDPRANFPRQCRFECDYHDDGITVTLTRLEDFKVNDKSIKNDFRIHLLYSLELRVYDPLNELVPDFNSKVYLYLGVDYETAPLDTSIAIIDPSVKKIKRSAFVYCTKMKRCIIHDKVEAIGVCAFFCCISLDALFLPPSLENIGMYAFCDCRNIRILPLPLHIDNQNIGERIIVNCHAFSRITKTPLYHRYYNSDRIHQDIIDFHRNLPPLHKACLDINVSAQAIHDCILTHGTDAAYNADYGGMTPMHILALNPHATKGPILKCFYANMSAVFVRYGEGHISHRTIGGKMYLFECLVVFLRCGKVRNDHSTIEGMSPLECLMEYDLESHTMLVTALCMHRESYSFGERHIEAAKSEMRDRKRIN